MKRRHSDKGKRWLYDKYFRALGSRNWVFFASEKNGGGESRSLDLLVASTTKIVRHIQIKARANPYDRDWDGYFDARIARRRCSPVPVRLSW